MLQTWFYEEVRETEGMLRFRGERGREGRKWKRTEESRRQGCLKERDKEAGGLRVEDRPGPRVWHLRVPRELGERGDEARWEFIKLRGRREFFVRRDAAFCAREPSKV